MKKISLKEKTPAELDKLLAETREELRVLRVTAAGSRPKDAAAPKKARRQIARVLTELTTRAKAA